MPREVLKDKNKGDQSEVSEKVKELVNEQILVIIVNQAKKEIVWKKSNEARELWKKLQARKASIRAAENQTPNNPPPHTFSNSGGSSSHSSKNTNSASNNSTAGLTKGEPMADNSTKGYFSSTSNSNPSSSTNSTSGTNSSSSSSNSSSPSSSS
ncbi:4034_t:CDS:2, partial [Entrophospora sp. SA101]